MSKISFTSTHSKNAFTKLLEEKASSKTGVENLISALKASDVSGKGEISPREFESFRSQVDAFLRKDWSAQSDFEGLAEHAAPKFAKDQAIVDARESLGFADAGNSLQFEAIADIHAGDAKTVNTMAAAVRSADVLGTPGTISKEEFKLFADAVHSIPTGKRSAILTSDSVTRAVDVSVGKAKAIYDFTQES